MFNELIAKWLTAPCSALKLRFLPGAFCLPYFLHKQSNCSTQAPLSPRCTLCSAEEQGCPLHGRLTCSCPSALCLRRNDVLDRALPAEWLNFTGWGMSQEGTVPRKVFLCFLSAFQKTGQCISDLNLWIFARCLQVEEGLSQMWAAPCHDTRSWNE